MEHLFLIRLTHPGCCTIDTTSVWCRSARWYLQKLTSNWYCKGGDFIILELQKEKVHLAKVYLKQIAWLWTARICSWYYFKRVFLAIPPCHREPRLWQIHQLDSPRRASPKLAKQKHGAYLAQKGDGISTHVIYVSIQILSESNWIECVFLLV